MNIHIFHGLGGSAVPRYRRGTEKLEASLDARSLYADHWDWKDWKHVLELLRRSRGPIALIGHSQGVQSAMRIASQYGGLIDYIAAIDPTLSAFPKAGGNIGRIDEFHAKFGVVAMGRRIPFFKGGRIRFDRDFRGKHELFNLYSGHVAIASDAEVQSRIIQQIRKLQA